MNDEKLSSVELFAGIGGFRLAADAAGLRTIWANDICENACRVYREQFGDDVLVEADLRQVLRTVPFCDILSAGFPCQPFSGAGKKRGLADSRGRLFNLVADIIRRTRPKFFVLENVPRLLSMNRGKTFATMLGVLSDLGYLVEWRILNAADFGLAQNRRRVFLAGRDFSPPSQILFDQAARLCECREFDTRGGAGSKSLVGPTPWRPVRRHQGAFPNWGMVAEKRFVGMDLKPHVEVATRLRVRDVLEDVVGPEFDFTSSTRERLKVSTQVDRFENGVQILYNQNGGKRLGYSIFGIDGLAPTLTASSSRHFERYRVGGSFRRLTPVEYARLQGFPDDHCRCVPANDQYVLLGNAVPPVMAEWVFRRLVQPASATGTQGAAQFDAAE